MASEGRSDHTKKILSKFWELHADLTYLLLKDSYSGFSATELRVDYEFFSSKNTNNPHKNTECWSTTRSVLLLPSGCACAVYHLRLHLPGGKWRRSVVCCFGMLISRLFSKACNSSCWLILAVLQIIKAYFVINYNFWFMSLSIDP